MLVLKLLSEKDMYGYEMIDTLRKRSQNVFEFKAGTLYPLLTRLKNDGLLAYEWQESTQGPPRKYYRLTDEGQQFLMELDKAWSEIERTISVLKKTPSPHSRAGLAYP